MFYDDKIVIPKPLRQTVIMLRHKVHPAINKMKHAARPFWWHDGRPHVFVMPQPAKQQKIL